MTFEPELGQAVFTNSPWHELSMDDSVERMLLTIGDVLKGKGLVDENPCFNVGEEFTNPTFQMRSYCWCDGIDPGHSDGCPPNFQWRDFRCAWYKHVGRGNSQNRDIAAEELVELLSECVGSL